MLFRSLILMALLVAGVKAEEIDGDWSWVEKRKASEARMSDFVGGVMGDSGATLGNNCATSNNGKLVYFDGKGFYGTYGYYGHDRALTWGSKGLVAKSGDLYYGSSLSFQNTTAYFRLNDAKPSYIVTSGGVSATMRKP